MNKDLGKIITNTQNDVTLLKQQLDMLNNASKTDQSPETAIIYDNLKDYLVNFDQTLVDKLEFLYKKVINAILLDIHNIILQTINNQDATVQRLPQIKLSELQQVQQHGPAETQKNFSQPKLNIPDPRLGPLSKQSYISKSSLNKQKDKKPALQKKYDPKKLPILLPTLKEEQLQQGVINLVNKGVIAKNANLQEALFKGIQPIQNQNLQLLQYQDQFQKRKINTGKEGCELFAHYDRNINKLIEDTQPNQKSSLHYSSNEKINKFKLFEAPVNFHSNLKAKFLKERQLSLDQESNEDKQQQELQGDKQLMELMKYNQKNYAEILDTYSLHHFIIRKGKTLEETPEFKSYKRTFIAFWEPISKVIKQLERLLYDYSVKIANIDGKRVASLAMIRQQPLTVVQLVECIVNYEQLVEVLRIPELMFRGPNGRKLAAIKLQAFWRMYCAQRDYERLKILISKVRVIQRAVKIWNFYKKTKKRISKKNERILEQHKKVQSEFEAQWDDIKFKPRFEIHINSFNFDELKRLTMEKYSQKQNLQITRIFALKDPLLSIIYVCPFDLSTELISYYHKVLELSSIANAKERLFFVWPENYSKLPSHFSLSKVLQYSAKAMRRIRTIIKGNHAYIVPGYPSNDDIKLSNALQVPLFSGEPQRCLIMSTKSSAKRMFNAIEVPTAPSSYEIYDEREFVNSLTLLIVNNPSIKRWVFKIDDEFGGRGIAVINLGEVKGMKSLLKMSKEELNNQEYINQIKDILTANLQFKTKMAMPTLYPTYKEFMMNFCRKGGIIEGMPNCLQSAQKSCAIFFVIEPTGNMQLLGSYDKITAKEFVNIAAIFPQTSLPGINLEAVIKTVGNELFKKKIYGYITIDMVSFPDPTDKNGHPLFWAIGIDCYLNNYNCSYFYFDMLIKGNFDSISGQYLINEDKQQSLSLQQSFNQNLNTNNNNVSLKLSEKNDSNKETRMFLYCPFLNHPGLINIQYKTFFHMCRVEQISFDLEKKIGSTFILIDSLQTGVIGLMAISDSQKKLFRIINNALKFLNKQSNNYLKDLDDSSRQDKVSFADIMSKMKLFQKKYEEIEKKKDKTHQNLTALK